MLMRVVWCLFGLNISALFTCVSERVNATHGSSPHRCYQSSHHHHRISIWWEYISYCCTETVHPRTPSQRRFQYLRTTAKRFTDNLRPSQYIYYCTITHDRTERIQTHSVLWAAILLLHAQFNKAMTKRRRKHPQIFLFLSVLFQTKVFLWIVMLMKQ